jgi:hypothetical protein
VALAHVLSYIALEWLSSSCRPENQLTARSFLGSGADEYGA